MLSGFDHGIDRVDNPDEHNVVRLHNILHDAQDGRAISFAGHLQIEPALVHLEEIRQQLCIIDIRAMRRIEISSWADMYSDLLALLCSKAIEHLIVQMDEVTEKLSRWIELQ